MLAPLTDEIRSNAQTCRVGMLATMVDVAGSDPVLAAWNPDWTATQDLSVYAAGSLTEGPIVVDARLLRRGKKIIFVEVDIYDGHGVTDIDELKTHIDGASAGNPGRLTLAAKSLVTFTRIPRTGATGVDTYDPNKWVGSIRKRSADQHNTDLLNDRIGLKVCDRGAGVVEVANSPYVSNSIGTINGGVQAFTLEAAAEIMRPGMTATDIQIHFLSQLKVGPSRTRGTVIRDARGHSVVQVQLLDAGADDKLIATATVTLQRLLRRY
ncbi:MAG TPA: acyl-CoA thioesterase domain-containing protein [Dongiaceae bacterium]|nr:acyl-CoA thioesterase domain-containing protein [Dongiaceae bacterium]